MKNAATAAVLCFFLCGCVTEQRRSKNTGPPAVPQVPAASVSLSPTVRKILASAHKQTRVTRIYDPAYVSLPYPGGDIPPERGVCADVIVRAFRAADVDLQRAVHEDMRANFGAYPHLWGLKRPDPNIDHRRVANLQTFLRRRGNALPVTRNPLDYRPADVVAWELPGNRLHIGLVSEQNAPGSARPTVIHNVGAGTRQEDVLFVWKVIGHYRSSP